MKHIDWVGIILDNSSVVKMEELFKRYKQQTMKHWFVASDHITMGAGKPEDYFSEFKDKGYEITVYEIGWNQTAMAVKVKFNDKFKTLSHYPHLTLAYDLKFGKGGFNSNFIQYFERLDKPIKIKGDVKFGRENFKNKR